MFHDQFVTSNCRVNEGSMNLMFTLGGLINITSNKIKLDMWLLPIRSKFAELLTISYFLSFDKTVKIVKIPSEAPCIFSAPSDKLNK